jgi:HAD superfamily hydrolase (TIGR01549 family)
MAPEDEAYVHAHAVHESYARIVPAERLHEVGEAARRVDYAANVLPSLELEPGLVDLLEDLMAASVRLGIDTNRTTTLDMVVERFGFERYFSPIVGAHMAGPKPDPASVALILREWGIAASQVAFVGDSSVDEATAKAAGVRFWAYKNGNLDAELYVPDFPTLRAALQKCYAAS